MFSAHFVSEVVALALQVARQQRNEDHLQSPDILYRKFIAEQKELAEAKNIWDEIPDVVYYATCLLAQDEKYTSLVVEDEILPQYGIAAAQAQQACLAKYRLRAAGAPKDIEKERTAILAAIA